MKVVDEVKIEWLTLMYEAQAIPAGRGFVPEVKSALRSGLPALGDLEKRKMQAHMWVPRGVNDRRVAPVTVPNAIKQRCQSSDHTSSGANGWWNQC